MIPWGVEKQAGGLPQALTKSRFGHKGKITKRMIDTAGARIKYRFLREIKFNPRRFLL
jgi:hypothetical protein